MNESTEPDNAPSRVRSGPLAHSFSETGWGYLCAGPAFAFLTVLALVPIFGAVWLGFHRHLPIFRIYEFVALRNYLALLQDERFWAACATTIYFTAVSVSVEVLLGLGIALFLDGLSERAWLEDTGGRSGLQWSWMQAIVLVPWAIPTVVSARMWDWIYQPEQGVLNYLLVRAGLIGEPVFWLGDPASAIHAAILMDVWKATPFAALLLLAGLKAIPRDLSQAARVDGARDGAIFRHVTLPLLTPVILIVLVFRTMDAFRVFDAVYVLTGGGPGNSTETLSIYAYKTLFQTLQFGYGSALASMMFVAMLIITGSYVLLMRRRLREVA